MCDTATILFELCPKRIVGDGDREVLPFCLALVFPKSWRERACRRRAYSLRRVVLLLERRGRPVVLWNIVKPTRVLSTTAASVLFSAPLLCQLAAANCNVQDSTARPTAIVASGGSSKGSYQAGVLWGFLQYERRVRQASSRDAIKVTSIAGASAGNVNALLSAIEWATPISTNRDETRSLLWHAWTNVGLSTLLRSTVHETDQAKSLLRPEAFDFVVDSLRALRRAPGLLSCELALGLTLTRSDSVTAFGIRDVRSARVLRHVSYAVLRTNEDGIELDTINALTVPRSAGLAISALQDLAGHVDFDGFLDHMRASAAFPVAFPPRRLTYVRIDTLLFRNRVARRGVFLDGGVFDNEPMAVASDLLDMSPTSARRPCSEGQARNFGTCQILYVSANRVRRRGDFETGAGNTPSTDQSQESSTSVTGVKFGAQTAVNYSLSDFGRFFRLSLGSVADQEMVMFERSVRSGGYSCDNVRRVETCFVATSRHFPIFGTMLASFGAFFGRPLREVDFYVGVYDGVTRAVSKRYCQFTTGAILRTACLSGPVLRVLEHPDSLPELSPVGRRITTYLLRSERDSLGQNSRSEIDSIDDPREKDLRRALSAVRAARIAVDSLEVSSVPPETRRRLEARLCSFSSVVLKAFCNDGFLLAAKEYRDLGGYADIGAEAVANRTDSTYFSDSMFRAFVRNPERESMRIGRSLLSTLSALEGSDSSEPTRTLARAAIRTADFFAGKALDHTKSTGRFSLSSGPSDWFTGRRAGPIRRAALLASPIAVSFAVGETPTVTWAPVRALYLRGNAVSPTVSLNARGVGAAGFRFQTRSISSSWYLPSALHSRAERYLRTQGAQAVVDAQLMWFARSVGLGLSIPVEDRRLRGSRAAFVLSVNDLPAILHLVLP